MLPLPLSLVLPSSHPPPPQELTAWNARYAGTAPGALDLHDWHGHVVVKVVLASTPRNRYCAGLP